MPKQIHFFRGYGLLLAVTLFVILQSCQKKAALPEDMVAQVNDNYLTETQLNYRVPDGLSSDVRLALKKQIITRWVESEALYQAAQAEGLTLSEQEKFFVNEYRKGLLVQKFLDEKLNRDYRISQKEIDDYYREHRDEFIRDQDEVRLIHLFMEQKDKAIFSEIAKSDDLLQIVKKYYFNEKSTAERPNGDLGYVPFSSLLTQFQRVIKRMKTGAISRPIKTKDGYHFFQLLDRQPKGSVRELDLVRDEIIIKLKREKRQQEKERLLNEAKSKAQIQTYLSKIEQ